MTLRSAGLISSVAILVVLTTGRSLATPSSSGAKSREFIVEGNKGAYEVTVAPAYVTVFYLPEPVKKALASDQANFSISVMDNTVTVRPVKGAAKGAANTANLNIDTATMHVSVILRVGNEAEAVSQVSFVRAEDKAVLEERVQAEVERQLAPLRAELETTRKNLETEITNRANDELARRVLRRWATKSLDGIARTDDHVVVRVKQAMLVGDDWLIWFNVQNRNDDPYKLQSVVATQGESELPSRSYFERTVADGKLLGEVAGGQRASGLVVIPVTKLDPKRTIELRFVDARDGKALVIDKLHLD